MTEKKNSLQANLTKEQKAKGGRNSHKSSAKKS